MSEKIAMGIGVPYVDPALVASAAVGEGYYYQLDLADPRVGSGWVAGPLLHDGSTSSGHTTASGGTVRYISLLVSKSAGMTFDIVTLAPGYAGSFSLPIFYGSDDLTSWTAITMNSAPALLPHSTFSYEVGLSYGRFSTVTYKYLAFSLIDSASGNAQVGCADIRVLSGVSEVGP